jgi:ABC-type transport system involved in cytochrome c biogenesis permease subunit
MRLLLGGGEALASLKLAVLVIAASAFVLGWATFVEREYGTPAVHFGIYGTWWFAGLLGLLGLNVLAAALIRFPWQRHQTGFVITHAGIILLLIGCLQSRLGGIDAQLLIFEGDAGHVAFEDKQHLELRIEPSGPQGGKGKLVRIPFTPGPFNWRDYSADLLRLPWRDYDTLYWFPWRLAHRDAGPIYRGHGLELSATDYLSDSLRQAAGPDDRSAAAVVPVPFDKRKDKLLKQRRVRLQLSLDGRTETAWLDGLPMVPAESLGPSLRDGQQWTVQGKDRQVKITLAWDEIDTGFRLYLHKFNRRLDPGTSQPSHYSSLVSRLPPESAAEIEARRKDPAAAVEAEKIPITLNEPVSFADPGTGLSYRMYQESFQGPFRPGDRTFDALAGPTDRDELWQSVLSVNYDPGRGLKYFGCLLVVAGIATMFYMRAYFFRPANATRTGMSAKIAIGALILLASPAALDARAEPATPATTSTAAKLDWTAWKHIPAFDNGRIMPLNTFAMSVVQTICDTESPTLALVGTADSRGNEPESLAAAKALFPDGKPRKFTAPELLLSWLAEPQRWEAVPFLAAGHEGLRRDVLGLPVVAAAGHLKYVSPWQVMHSEGFRQQMLVLARKQTESAKLAAIEEKTRSLFDAISLFRLVSYDPMTDLSVGGRFDDRLHSLAATWQELGPGVREMVEMGLGDRVREAANATGKSIVKLIELAQKQDVTLQRAEPILVALEKSSVELAQQLAEVKRVSFAGSPAGISPEVLDVFRTKIHALAAKAGDLARQARQAHYALYDTGHALRLVPALDPAALEKNRDAGDEIPPWLAFQTLMCGSPDVLQGYPADLVQQVRASFRRAAGAYVDRGNPQRAAAFQAAMSKLAASLDDLGRKIEPARKELPIQQRDDDLVKATAYPPAGSTATEVFYNDLDPFFWSWMVSLGAMAALALALGVFRKPLVWTGLTVLLLAQAFTIGGLALRVAITGWAPVTNMFETVIFVALVVALLGIWFALLPLSWPGLSSSWRMTAIPGSFEAAPPGPDLASIGDEDYYRRAGLVLLLPRVALAAGLVYLLAFKNYGYGNAGTLIAVWPRMDVGTSVPTVQNLLVWVVGLCMAGVAVWLLPRLALSFALAVVNVPYTLAKRGIAQPLAEVVARKPFLLAGASVSFLAAIVAYYAPVLNKNISPLQPVLRSNLWLTFHVLTITASYAAGVLAWALANIALRFYLFGRYRKPSGESRVASGEFRTAGQASSGTRASTHDFQSPVPDPRSPTPDPRSPSPDPRPPTSTFRLPPEICDTLGNYLYKVIQVAVLLLAAGTILGGLWADVSWGRFWGWDSKEVWALVSLLIYLAVLHGRYAGWFGNFGLAVGAVVGACSILMAWYGVNFVLGSGLHTYGEGVGGVQWALLLVAANGLFAILAALRYRLETSLVPGH